MGREPDGAGYLEPSPEFPYVESYDGEGRLTRKNDNGSVTTFDYLEAGLRRVTEPDGSQRTEEYVHKPSPMVEICRRLLHDHTRERPWEQEGTAWWCADET